MSREEEGGEGRALGRISIVQNKIVSMSYHYQEAEKFINEEFWKSTHDSRSKLDIPKLIESRLIKDNEEKDPEYYRHREGVIHATSVAKCLRGVVHGMLGAKPDNPIDTRKLGIFKAGNLFEDFVIAALGDRVVHAQREYDFKYKNIRLVGRSDYTMDDEGIMRVGENKSVHSDSFWMREREGTLVAWHNQIQLQIYMWMERELFGNEWEGVFSYISKDDCTVIGAPVKFNRNIIDQIVIPALDIINEAYTAKNPELAPLPSMVIFSEAKHQYQRNWLATYCEYHSSCAGAGWVLEASNLVTKRNKELKAAMPTPAKKVKPKIEVVRASELPPDEQVMRMVEPPEESQL